MSVHQGAIDHNPAGPFSPGDRVDTIEGPGCVVRCTLGPLWGGWHIIVRLDCGRGRSFTRERVAGANDYPPFWLREQQAALGIAA